VCPSLSSTIANIAASFPQVIWCCSGACCTHQLSDIADQAKEDQQNHTANLQLPPGTEAQKAHRKAAINKSGPKLNNSKKTYYNGFLRHFDNGCLERFADGLGKNQAMYQDLGEQRPDDVVPRFDLDLDLFPALVRSDLELTEPIQNATRYLALLYKHNGIFDPRPFARSSVQQWAEIKQFCDDHPEVVQSNWRPPRQLA